MPNGHFECPLSDIRPVSYTHLVVSITKGCAVAGLGGKPVYRTGDYNYYITQKIRSNDAKPVGPFIMASQEWDRLFQKNSCGTACE